MRLFIKLNVVLFLVFALALVVTGQISWTLLQANAHTEIVQTAKLLMDAALAARRYTTRQVSPLLDTQMQYTFLPQSIPAYSATEVFADVHAKHPEYAYKEAALNPTNPRDRAVEWESDIIGQYRNGVTEEIMGTRATPSGESFYVSRPIKITDGACLRCHSTVEAAPKTLIEHYGPANGFGWQLNDVIGAQIISVPTSVAAERAKKAFLLHMGVMLTVFVVIAGVLNLALWRLVTRPVVAVSEFADRISLGEFDVPELKSSRSDEIGVLVRSIGRMRASLSQALKMLEA